MVCASEGDTPKNQISLLRTMAKLQIFQPFDQTDIANWDNEEYINAEGETRWTSLTYKDNNDAHVAKIEGFDILEEDALGANSFHPIFTSDDILVGSWGADELLGYEKQDQIIGGWGDDFIHGMHGKDVLDGGGGNDTIRGGHGHDELWGGSGEDFLWGGTGRNMMYAGNIDGQHDDLYVSADSVNNTESGNPDGVNADILNEVGLEDSIWIHGVEDAALTYVAGVTDPKGSDASGVGIYANGTLEALVVGDYTTFEVNVMTTGGFY